MTSSSSNTATQKYIYVCIITYLSIIIWFDDSPKIFCIKYKMPEDKQQQRNNNKSSDNNSMHHLPLTLYLTSSDTPMPAELKAFTLT